MKISGDQIAHIRALLDSSEVTSRTLRDDLLDHLCCVVDNKMSKGDIFDTALREALQELAPNGLDKIQRDTYILLQSPQIILMKKVIYAVGFVSACAISVGWMFIIFRWPGGPELFNYGLLGFLLGFVPLLSVSRLKRIARHTWWQRMYTLAALISSLSVGVSLVFKLWHLQGADHLLAGGVLLFAFGFLPLLFFSLYKRALAAPVYRS